MRPATIRRVLAGPQLCLFYPPADRFWHACFQRAYSRSVLSRDVALTTLWRGTEPCPAGIPFHPWTCKRPYTRYTVADTRLTRNKESPIHATQFPVALEPITISSKRRWRVKDIIIRLAKALQDQDLKSSLSHYLVLRHVDLPIAPHRRVFQYQCRLVQLFHRTRIEALENAPAHTFPKHINLQDRRRSTVLNDIARSFATNPAKMRAVAKLVDAIAKSRAMVQHSYRTDSMKKLQDWREALRILENWALFCLPSTPEAGNTVTKEGSVQNDASGTDDGHAMSLSIPVPSLASLPPQEFRVTNRVLKRELSTWLTRLMKRLVYSHTDLIRIMLDTMPQRFGIPVTVDMYLVSLRCFDEPGWGIVFALPVASH